MLSFISYTFFTGLVLLLDCFGRNVKQVSNEKRPQPLNEIGDPVNVQQNIPAPGKQEANADQYPLES